MNTDNFHETLQPDKNQIRFSEWEIHIFFLFLIKRVI